MSRATSSTNCSSNPRQFEQSLGGVLKPVAILFSDIRGYSVVSARTDPQALVSQLNEYLSAMVECVFRHGGTLDKFIGDAVMAVWGNVRTDGIRNDATGAVRAAVAMREELVRLNAEWKERGLSELRVGIAVNHGEVVVGNVGSPRRMEFTVIGEAVNVSWRLQELTKQLGRGPDREQKRGLARGRAFRAAGARKIRPPGYARAVRGLRCPTAHSAPGAKSRGELRAALIARPRRRPFAIRKSVKAGYLVTPQNEPIRDPGFTRHDRRAGDHPRPFA